MKFYNEKPAILARDFHRLKTNSSDEIKESIHTILINLNIPKAEWKKFSEITIYEFLLQLARDGHPQINYIIEVLDQKTKIGVLDYVLGGGILVSFFIYLLSLPALQVIIKQTTVIVFSSIISFPIIGLIFNIGVFAYFFYNYYYDLKKTDFNRTRDILFLILSTAATLAAYAILIATAATMSPVIAGLYVASAGIDFLREVFCLGQEFYYYFLYHYNNKSKINENNKDNYLRINREYILEVGFEKIRKELAINLRNHREYFREIYGFEKRRYALAISFIAGLIIVGITALWCFLPGGMVATVVALSAIGIVHLIKLFLVKRNETLLREQQQVQLKSLEIDYEELLLKLNTLEIDLVIPCTPDRYPFIASLGDKNLLSCNKAESSNIQADISSSLKNRLKTPYNARSRQSDHLPRVSSTPITPSRLIISQKDIMGDLKATPMNSNKTLDDRLKSPRYSHSANNSRQNLLLSTPSRLPFWASLNDKDLMKDSEQTLSDSNTHEIKNTPMQPRKKFFHITNPHPFPSLEPDDNEQEYQEEIQRLEI